MVKVKKNEVVAEKPTTIDRLTALRKKVSGPWGSENELTELLDILLDEHGGDSEAVRGEIADEHPDRLAEQAEAEAAAGAKEQGDNGDGDGDGDGDGEDETADNGEITEQLPE